HVDLRPRLAVMRDQLVVGRDLILRGLAFQACFLSATAVVGRFSVTALAAHQIALQLWLFCALALDAVAIAAQSLVGASLGGGRGEEARSLANRIAVIGGVCGLGLGALIGAGAWVVPGWFTSDPAVQEQALVAWPWFALMQPLAGIVFALDGVLIGAGDVRYMRNLTLAAALGGFLPAIWTAHILQLGLNGVWAGLTLFIVIRLAALVLRLRSGRWAITGAQVTPAAR
uniref:MATE family efflux transporter n=1 Tax=Allorhizocola rhizosphaerae TaxID=1872709 RepID=UPI001FE478B9